MTNQTPARGMNRLQKDGARVWLVIGLCLAVVLLQSAAFGQVANGSLTGTVFDSSGAVVPRANVFLTNEASKVVRETSTNDTGSFSFVAIPPGTYSVKVVVQGFSPWMTNLVFNQGENRNLAKISLKVGTEAETVNVEANPDLVPLNTGETRQTLNQLMVQQIAITGRDAAELIRLMPGMGMNNGLSQKQWNSEVTQTGSGPIGQFSANGSAPYGGMAMTTDGANIVDSGNQGTQIANVNQDQTAEVTLLNSAYGAEFAKGPVVFQAISKSGGNVFHGSAYLYARNGIFNAEDAFLKAQKVKHPDESYYYPGFTLGGPVIIPGTDFNKKREKLFFFTGYEYMKQSPAGTLHRSVVPTDAMRNGDFSAAQVTGLNRDSGLVPCYDRTAWPMSQWCASAAGLQIVNGVIPKSMFDPSGAALMALLPKPNQAIDADGYNFHYLDQPPFDRWEYRAKIDYVLNSKHRLTGGYTRQNETDINNFGVWWWPGGTVPYPSTLPAKTKSTVWSFNFTSTFTPSLTNEVVFTLAKYINPVRPSNAAAVDPASVGFTAKRPFEPDMLAQIPNIVNWSCGNSSGTAGCFPNIYGPGFAGGFENGAFGAAKSTPAIADNLSKMIGTHMLKFGFYWDQNANKQASGYGSWGQGMYDFDWWHNGSTYNPLADMLLGHAASFSQVSAIPTYDARYHQLSFYAQDQWRATRRLTLTYGLRFDHEGQWYATDHPGFAVWDPAKYNNASNAAPFSGMAWHAIDNSVPVSGFTSPTFYYAPRIGVAYDLFGEGKTVIRGGFGVYRWQFSNNDIAVAQAQGLGIQNVSTGELMSLTEAANYKPAAAGSFNSNQMLLQRGDDRTPFTQSWNVTISQQMPWKSILEATYSGNRSRDMLLTGNGTNVGFLANINKIPMGSLFKANPKTGTVFTEMWQGQPVATGNVPDGDGSGQVGDYRPYSNYGGALILVTHGSYANYHALQMAWRKQTGPLVVTANYTFSKVLGIRDGQTNNGNGDGATVDPFDLRSNYGPLAFDHSHIFNLAYVIRIPGLKQGNTFLKTLLNGWELSGVSQLQSGAPLQPNTGGNFNVQWSGDHISTKSLYGTNGFASVLPVLTCDPRKGLSSNQYFNPNCFTGPQQGQIGNTIWPYIKGPKYTSNDLSLYKNININEQHKIQLRLNAFNFLNHPLRQFGLGNDVNLGLEGTRTAGNFFGPITYKQTNKNFTGTPEYKVGRRSIELAIKYEF